MEMSKYIELHFRVVASIEEPESDVGYEGGITIEDVTLDGQSVYTGDIQSVIEQKIRDLELEMMEEVNEEMIKRSEDWEAEKADHYYEQIKDRRMMDAIENRYQDRIEKVGARPCTHKVPF
jgi:hypothetical protein